MSALSADILVVGRALGDRDVVMLTEKARQGMGHARNVVAPIKNRVATASARRAAATVDSGVVDLMAEERASD